MHAKSLQSCPTLCNPMDSSPPGSSVHRILQARMLEWVVISFSIFLPRVVKNIESESTLVNCKDQRAGVGEERNGDLVLNGDRVSVQEDENFRRWMMVRVVQHCECTQFHRIVQLNVIKIVCFIMLCGIHRNKKKKIFKRNTQPQRLDFKVSLVL